MEACGPASALLCKAETLNRPSGTRSDARAACFTGYGAGVVIVDTAALAVAGFGETPDGLAATSCDFA